MDRVLKIKLIIIGLFVTITSYIFFDELFSYNTDTTHQFGEIAFLVASISFGVIITASIYNLSFYFYMKNRQYLYYGLAQISTLIFLINLDALFISPFDHIFGFKSITVFCLSALSILFFSLYFIEEFLKNYQVKNVQKVIKILRYLVLIDVVISLTFSVSIFTSFLFLPIWLVLSEAYREIKDKDLPFYFLITGWYIVIFIAMIEHLGFINFIGVPFPFLHITFAIESIFLSLAIAYKFKLTEEKQKTQQALLLQQSRLASMGEMISTIAHQWRQPLNNLALIQMNLNRLNKKDKEHKFLLDEANNQIKYMSQTIETFRNFYNPSKSRVEFSVKEAIEDTLTILNFSLEQKSINIEITLSDKKFIYGNKNEFEQVILNLLNNAKEALIEFEINAPTIKIQLTHRYLKIKDNAGGIAIEHQDKIFTPYFSTKGGDGIGLYISKMIIEKEFGGFLDFKVDPEGTEFFIEF